MDTPIRSIQIAMPDGTPILSLRLGYDPDGSANATGSKNSNARHAKDGTSMTDAQKRYLFRLLAEREIEGDRAHAYLKKAFSVDSLEDASKAEASALIERLVEESERTPTG